MMTSYSFKVGDRAVFIRDNTAGGKTFGVEGQEIIIARIGSGSVSVGFDFVNPLIYQPTGAAAWMKDLRPCTVDYAADQEGEDDDLL